CDESGDDLRIAPHDATAHPELSESQARLATHGVGRACGYAVHAAMAPCEGAGECDASERRPARACLLGGRRVAAAIIREERDRERWTFVGDPRRERIEAAIFQHVQSVGGAQS